MGTPKSIPAQTLAAAAERERCAQVVADAFAGLAATHPYLVGAVNAVIAAIRQDENERAAAHVAQDDERQWIQRFRDDRGLSDDANRLRAPTDEDKENAS